MTITNRPQPGDANYDPAKDPDVAQFMGDTTDRDNGLTPYTNAGPKQKKSKKAKAKKSAKKSADKSRTEATQPTAPGKTTAAKRSSAKAAR